MGAPCGWGAKMTEKQNDVGGIPKMKLPMSMEVAFVIYESQICDETIWYEKIVRIMDGKYSSSEVGDAIKELIDYGMITSKWDDRKNGVPGRVLEINGDIKSLVGDKSPNLISLIPLAICVIMLGIMARAD